jgi:hypothetical protein
MLGEDDNENKRIGKASQRKATVSEKAVAKTERSKKAEPGRKSEPRKRKEAQSSIPKPDQLLDALQRLAAQGDDSLVAPFLEQASAPIPEQIEAPVVSTESSVSETFLPQALPVAAAEPAETTSVSLQTIADAYGDYSKKSIEQTSCFVAKLATAGSLDKALELQTAFAREAYETFVAESRRIRELHRELAKQRLTRLEGFVMGTMRSR